MKYENIITIFSTPFKILIKNPLIILFPLILLAILKLFSFISVSINYKLQNSIALTLWLIFFSFISLALLAFFFSGLIGISKDIQQKNLQLKKFLVYSKKFWFRNFLIILLITTLSFLSGRTSHYLAFYIGKALNLSTNLAVILFFLIHISILLGIIIFFTYSSFFLVLYNLKTLESIKSSIKFVKKEYINTLTITLLIFIVFFILEKNKNILFDLIEYGLIVPYISILLTKFILSNNDLST